ncbi:hypothetical protein DQ04_01171010 [Trypanosoma grayi]|uniref:hypothetical protein n=1 Tax=Trypanosoma grayi TaxID=71804 RepID=UPI0004F45F00|nr:hypothetical protein DQ04_01171010 [Trypanosoma grayi]KEG13168.1 hypothetical protein DQ04_01171010 [Trypanosoma grayi]
MAAFAERIRKAADFVNRARDEETPDGNPLVAARHYITAMEIIASVGDEVPIKDANSRRFFLYQLRQRMEMYYERAQLLLGVAEEAGTPDKPTKEGGLQAALKGLSGSGGGSDGCGAAAHTTNAPPLLYAGNEGGGGGGGEHRLTSTADTSGGTVLGIPLGQSIQPADETHDQPPVGFYFSQPPSVPAPPDHSLDTLLDRLTLGDEKK